MLKFNFKWNGEEVLKLIYAFHNVLTYLMIQPTIIVNQEIKVTVAVQKPPIKIVFLTIAHLTMLIHL